MAETYTGVKVFSVGKETVDSIYRDKQINIPDKRFTWYQNEYVVLKDDEGSSSSAIAKVKNDKLVLVNNKQSAGKITAKNKEQIMALDALLDQEVECVVLTGKAGTGKSLLAINAAVELIEKGKYDKIIITKNMTQLGNKSELGYLPGGTDEKFIIFNQGILSSISHIMGGDSKKLNDVVERFNIEFLPLAVVRGSSWEKGTIIICDESQNMSEFEVLTLGTRCGTDSKLILLADYNQIDLRMKKDMCGVYKFVNHEKAKNSKLVSSIHMLKVERGELSQLFSEIFDKEEDSV